MHRCFLLTVSMIAFSCAILDVDEEFEDAAGSDDKEICEPSDARVCVCRNRSNSVQECNSDGVWEKCDCPDDEHHDPVDKASDDANDSGDSFDTESSVPVRTSVVYVTTEKTLYYIDPEQGHELIRIGDFSGPCEQGSGLYDIAVDENENIVGIAAEGLYKIDRLTAACEQIAQFDQKSPHFFSLSYVKGVDPSEPERDYLMAASVEDGQWVQLIHDMSGGYTQFKTLGYHDPENLEMVSSGDIVSLRSENGFQRTYATLKCRSGYGDIGCQSDWLAEIDPVSGVAKMIGPTGFKQIFGLGFWGDKVYGFTNNNEFILMDTASGKGSLVVRYETKKFWGAGSVTTPYVYVE